MVYVLAWRSMARYMLFLVGPGMVSLAWHSISYGLARFVMVYGMV